MASEGKPSYLKAAFLNVYNLSLLGGAVTASVATNAPVMGAVALGLEAMWLLFGPDLRPFKRAVDQAARDEAELTERRRVQAQRDALPRAEAERARALESLGQEIQRDMQVNPSFQAMLLQSEIDKLSQLNRSFVGLAAACERAQSYLTSTDALDLKQQIQVQQKIEKAMTDPAVVELARKNILVLQRRLTTMGEIENFLARARGQMNLIENSVRLLRDQVLTMASPEQLTEELDDLLSGVAALQATERDNDGVMSLSPIAQVGEPEGTPLPSPRQRE